MPVRVIYGSVALQAEVRVEEADSFSVDDLGALYLYRTKPYKNLAVFAPGRWAGAQYHESDG